MVAALWRKSWKRRAGSPASCSNCLTSRQNGLVEISTILVGEDQVVDLPGTCTQSFLFLPETMRLERTDGDIWQRNCSSGTSCFRFCFQVLMLCAFCAVVIGQRTGYMQCSLAKSISDQCSANSSPWRMPVVSATVSRHSKRCCFVLATSSRCSACSAVR